MIRWVTHDEVRATRHLSGRAGQPPAWRTDFMAPPPATRLPQAFLIEYAPHRVLETHFHDADEFQIVIDGHGLLGRQPVAPVLVHFARAYTAYGPIVAGSEGLVFLTVRAQRDSAGPQRLSERRDVLEQVVDRRPWRASAAASFDRQAAALETLPQLSAANGLCARSVVLGPGAGVHLDAVAGDGRFVVVLEGAIVQSGAALPALSIGFGAAGSSGALDLVAGSQGARALVLDFPEPQAHERSSRPDAAWHCPQCGFVYDEREGFALDGIAPGTPWSDLPAEWTCPDCLAPKSAFTRGRG